MTEQTAISLLPGADAGQAEAAFAVLLPRARDFLRCYLRARLSEADVLDVTQTTLLRVWDNRARFSDRGRAAWLAYLKRIADHCLIDLLRARGQTAELPEEIPGEELDLIETLVDATETASGAEACRSAADVLWLELDPAATDEEHRRRLLAAQLFYLDGASWLEVLSFLNTARPADPVTRADLDGWLTDPAVLRHLGFSELHLDGVTLARCLLAARYGWSPSEAQVIEWRVRWGLPPDHVARRGDCPLGPEALRELGVRLAAALPFRGRMQELLHTVGERGGLSAGPHLGRTGLWQRLAFEYRYQDELSLRDIQDRIAPPAEEVQVEVTAGMLNVWLSGGRLLRRLAQHMRRKTDA